MAYVRDPIEKLVLVKQQSTSKKKCDFNEFYTWAYNMVSGYIVLTDANWP